MNNSHTKSISASLMRRSDRSLRLSSKEDQEMGPEKIRSIIQNNKYFPHLYDPYYERKDIKANLMNILKTEDKQLDDSNPYVDNHTVKLKGKLDKSRLRQQRNSEGADEPVKSSKFSFKKRNSSLSTKLMTYAPQINNLKPKEKFDNRSLILHSNSSEENLNTKAER